MSEANDLLRHTFLFTTEDLQANRSGRVSARQDARLRAGNAGMRFALMMFVVVMLGTFGIIILSASQMSVGTSNGDRSTTLIVLFAFALAIAVGGWLSRKHIKPTQNRQIRTASGIASIVIADTENLRAKIKIGETVLRLASIDQLYAFQSETDYRVHYLDGVVPIILSVEIVGDLSVESADSPALAQTFRASEKNLRRSYVMASLVAALALAIPALALFGEQLPKLVYAAAWFIIGALSIGLAFYAVHLLKTNGR